MFAERNSRRLASALAALAFVWSGQLDAETICTYVNRVPSLEHPVPLSERQSLRQVQSNVVPELIARSDELAAEGRLAEAIEGYDSAFGGFRDKHGMLHGSARCLSRDVYQQVADKLRAAASVLTAERLVKGHLLDESHSFGGPFERGALRLFLDSNQYDEYVDHAFDYAVSELSERDIDRALTVLADSRLEQLEQMQNAATSIGYRGLEDDLTPLLDEELAAFDKLAGFEENLKAHLAPLYPKITDHWLAEEASSYGEAIDTDGMIPKGLLFGRATAALERGIDRLYAHPEEVARLKSRASARGNALMTQEQYEPAEDYFEIAGDEQQALKAGRLAETEQDAVVERFEAAMKSDLEKLRKTDEEQAAFQDGADEMAAEFGFDLEQ